MRSFLYRLFDNSSSFAVLLRTATLTAARQLFLPNKDGTLAITSDIGTLGTQNASSVSITGGSATGLSSVTVTGSTASVNPQTGAVVVSGGLGVGGDANVGGTVGAKAFLSTQGMSGIILARNEYDANAKAIISGPYADRLQGATARYAIASSNVTGSLASIFDKSTNTRCEVPLGQTGWVEVDLLSNGNAARQYWSGVHTITFRSTVSRRPLSFTLEIQEPNDTWTTLANVSSIGQNIYIVEDTNGSGGRFCKKLRLTWTSKSSPNFAGGVMFWEFFPARPDGDEPALFLNSSSPTTQPVYGSMQFLSPNASGNTLIAPGLVSTSGYTVAQLQAGITGQILGSQAFCTDESGGAVPVFFDGTSWRRVTDRAVIS